MRTDRHFVNKDGGCEGHPESFEIVPNKKRKGKHMGALRVYERK